ARSGAAVFRNRTAGLAGAWTFLRTAGISDRHGVELARDPHRERAVPPCDSRRTGRTVPPPVRQRRRGPGIFPANDRTRPRVCMVQRSAGARSRAAGPVDTQLPAQARAAARAERKTSDERPRHRPVAHRRAALYADASVSSVHRTAPLHALPRPADRPRGQTVLARRIPAAG